jgi:cytochrome P450
MSVSPSRFRSIRAERPFFILPRMRDFRRHRLFGVLQGSCRTPQWGPKPVVDDLMGALVYAREAGDRLSEDELLAMSFRMLVVGHGTTLNLIGNGVLALLEHPAELNRLREDPDLIKPAVEGLMGYDSPVQMATERYVREDVTIAGVTIARGETVHAVLGSASRDERQFERPDNPDIIREPNRHLAFGQGLDYCVGAPLARLEGQIAINTLLRRYPDLKLAVPPHALRRRRGLGLRGVQSLPVLLSRRRAQVLQAAW